MEELHIGSFLQTHAPQMRKTANTPGTVADLLRLLARLLDDVFAELDAARREKLAEFTSSAEQLLITAAVGADIPAAVAGRRISVGVEENNGERRSEIVDDDEPGAPAAPAAPPTGSEAGEGSLE